MGTNTAVFRDDHQPAVSVAKMVLFSAAVCLFVYVKWLPIL